MGTQESQSLPSPSPPPNPTTAFPILAIALLCILATTLLLVIYYLLLTKFCLSLHQPDPLRSPPIGQSPPATYPSLGLSQTLIRKIPILHYTKTEGQNRELFECAVCLSEFETRDPLRVLPKCGHGFHLDCIDVWLQSNANCPLCRAGISGRRERLVPPAPSPSEEEHVVVDLGEDNRRKCRHGSMMGDEGVEMRENVVRRSFSMDSVVDRGAYMAVRAVREGERNRGEGSRSGRVRRSFFSFRQGRSNSVLPVEF